MSFTVKDVLKIQVAPALGCTEPVAIALGAAAAASILKSKKIDTIAIWVDPNIYKERCPKFTKNNAHILMFYLSKQRNKSTSVKGDTRNINNTK